MSHCNGNSNSRITLNDRRRRQNGEEEANNKDIWFNEIATLHHDDLIISTRINQLIHRQRSDYQNILIFQK